MGIEPTTSAWKAEVLPLNYTRMWNVIRLWGGWRESNPRMSEPQSDALTTSPQPPKMTNGSGQSRTADTWSFNPLLYQLSYWTIILIMAVSTGIEPAISCVTGRRVNRYTTRPIKTMYCGRRIWTTDLRVMSPTSYRTAPSRDNIIFDYLIIVPSLA